MAEAHLFPRNDVFSLLLPNLSHAGKSLTVQVVLATIKGLCRVQTPDHQISFDGWLLVAKEQLKWNDYCIQLFWDLLQAAVRYKEDVSVGWEVERELLEIEYIAIFLVLHIPDGTSRNSSPTAAYDTMWPHEGHVQQEDPKSPSRSLSPSGSPRKFLNIPTSSSSSPNSKSPRSPVKTSPSSSRPSSPKRFTPISPRQSPRSSSQQALCIRSKLSVILQALAFESISSEFDALGNELAMSLDLSRSASKGLDVILEPRSLDCLGLILSSPSEFNKADSCRTLSEVFLSSGSPFSSTIRSNSSQSLVSSADDDNLSRSASHDSIRLSTDGLPAAADSASREMRSSSVFDWIETNLSSSSNSSIRNEDDSGLRYMASDKPVKILKELSALVGISSVEVSDITSTFFFLATSGPAVCSSPGKTSSSSSTYARSDKYVSEASAGSAGSAMSGSGSEAMSEGCIDFGGVPESEDFDDCMAAETSSSSRFIEDDSWIRKSARANPSSSLPRLLVENCSGGTIFLLAPFSSATISNCSNCEIIIGAVSHIVYLVGCEAVKLTIASGKLIVRNCLDSLVHTASLSQTIICGDSRGLTFSPHNTSYKHLWVHMQMAGLHKISSISSSRANESDMEFDENAHFNIWSRVCDVTTCLESPASASSPTGYAIDAVGVTTETEVHRFLPRPPESVACFLQPDRFKATSIPHRPELLDIFESPIVLPARYAIGMKEKAEAISHFRQLLATSDDLLAGSRVAETEGVRYSSANITNGFVDWLVSTEKAQKILDLIKLDGEKLASSGGV